ncbi:DASH family cryptochrome [Fulvivirga lutimaris]|uniref:DASH family cryptochrome n=1 Tax=Fulvivirga lutimaris TaxID=1819566 RepID=UPI0012BB4C44|nr:DASH family cryptochrome [Fulvivirga lutimaris]MTI41134.1 DASH family cryptochrome [Fulvivirga lutimaris]
MKSNAIVWFRNDLRLLDNETLVEAAANFDIIPVYIFDPRHYKTSNLGFTRTGSFKTKFIIETLAQLKSDLQKIGSDLVIRIGKPEILIPAIAKEVNAVKVYASKEITYDEIIIEAALEASLFKNGIALKLIWQQTLFHQEDVPWPIKQVPDVFTQFRKEAESTVKVRALFQKPTKLPAVTNIELGELPTLSQLGLEETVNDKRAVLDFEGGERAANKRLDNYFWKQDLLKNYKETRNGLVGADYSSKLSPWLAVGAISPKTIYYEVKKYEKLRENNDSTYWLIFELLWRDFFKFMAKKHGQKIFLENGISSLEHTLKNDAATFELWQNGKTEDEFINANMNELRMSGFMSNRGRQIVASYLIHQLKVNWTWGAAWFEHSLIDYDPCSNWLNWAYIAGVGNDPRNGREFNVESQRVQHDPKGKYVALWS